MGSGGGGDTKSTTTNKLPAWAIPFAKQIFGQASADYFPNHQLLPASQGVANFSPDQLAAMQMTEQLSGVAPNAGQDYIDYSAGPPSNQNPQSRSKQPTDPSQILQLLGGVGVGGAGGGGGLSPMPGRGVGGTGAGGAGGGTSK